MGGFIDQYLPPRILGYEFITLPRWKTRITRVASGDETVAQEWQHPLHKFTAPNGIRESADVFALHEVWMALRGRTYWIPFRDPMDFASVPLAHPNQTPTISPLDVQIGVGDGVNKFFQLIKTYTHGSATYSRKISYPVVSTVGVRLNGLDPATTAMGGLPGGPYTWQADRETGVIEFDHAVSAGVVVTAGFLFDVAVRFESNDSYEHIVKTWKGAGFADLTFEEKRPC